MQGIDAGDVVDNKAQIQELIRRVYKWHEAKEPADDEMITDSNDSLYIGFSQTVLKRELAEMKATNLFSKAFLDNYHRIFITLDRKLRRNEIVWPVGELPPFGSGADPWCNCQDIPYDNPWDSIAVEIVRLTDEKAELVWKWGDTGANTSPEWKQARYRFRVVKEDAKWKIAYMEGFDFETLTRNMQ
ncbi:MAG TPA: hypothetical protein VK183_05015 [Flavobacterium sp.]|nr:hypothetical protein [Flavobacterium sp.]